MKAPTLQGTIERRLLINYRADPEVVGQLLPAPFRPQLVNDYAVVGICLLRLGELRPVGFPRSVGRRSENAAHRVAVEWDSEDGLSNGVYINRRDSESMVNVLVGGRVFPGRHQRSDFTVVEPAGDFGVGFESRDGSVSASVEARLAETLEGSRLFSDLEGASRFFASGSLGYSESRSGDRLEGMSLETSRWAIEPLSVCRATSTYFDDRRRFPDGSVVLDCGLVMRQVPVVWRSAGSLRLEHSARAG
jgi:Uncharacterized conserved protein (COG2071)